jgi:hypothetical protein
MGIDIRINIDLAPWQKRLIRMGVVTGSFIAAIGIGIVLASPQQWTTGQPLTATDINKLAVISNGTTQQSVGATQYCGTSAPTNGAISFNGLTGYAAAKAMCQASTGCGSSATAHMCSPEEVTRTLQLGASVGNGGWYTAGMYVPVPTESASVSDCSGWTSNTTATLGPTVAGTPPTPSFENCSNMANILCCD